MKQLQRQKLLKKQPLSKFKTMNEPLGSDVAEGFIRLRGTIAYDGRNFSGWGMQPDRRTVQGEMEEVFAQLMRTDRLVITCAGRTDAGVHSVGQVFHIDVPADRYPGRQDMVYKLNAILSEDVSVTDIDIAPDGFDARFSALSRSYRYLINDGVRNPVTRRHVYNYGWKLDVDLMVEGAKHLLGLHDFAAFCKQKEFATTIREVQEMSVYRDDSGVIHFDITADAFCYSMVRAIVGALVDIGAGRRDPSWIGEYLAGQTKVPAVFVAPALGLTFMKVTYPSDDQLAARSLETKHSRDGSR